MLKEIVRFQTDRELDKQDYNAINEHTNIVEELLESIGINISKEDRHALRDTFFGFVMEVSNKTGKPINEDISAHEQVDAYGDIIVFAIGAILKLGYDPEKVLEEVGKEINSRVGKMVDGKFQKSLSKRAVDKWYKADFDKCKRV